MNFERRLVVPTLHRESPTISSTLAQRFYALRAGLRAALRALRHSNT